MLSTSLLSFAAMMLFSVEPLIGAWPARLISKLILPYKMEINATKLLPTSC